MISRNKLRGQSLIEIVFSIGLIMLVMTGVVSLMIKSVGSRTMSYDRNKAVELSQIVMEDVIQKEVSDRTNFWNLSSSYWTALATPQPSANFDGYSYIVTPTLYSGNGCSATRTECINVTVKVSWQNNTKYDDQFNRFFSKK